VSPESHAANSPCGLWGKILFWVGPETMTFGSAWVQIEVLQSAEILTLPRHRFFLRNSSDFPCKIQSFPLLWKAAIQNSPGSRKSAVFSGFCSIDLARNAEISQRFTLSKQEDSETKQGDPPLQKWSPHFKFQI
jgi:hypothetical protein